MTAVVNNQMPKWAPRGRLLDAATPLAVSDNHWLEGLKLRYGALECRTLNVEGELDPCTDEGVTTTDTECLDTSSIYLPFRIWDYLAGSPLELTVDEITAVIDAGWSDTAISYAFAVRLRDYLADSPDTLPDFTSASAAITCCDAVAALDSQLAVMLGGRQGTIHMTRGALQACADDLELVDDRADLPVHRLGRRDGAQPTRQRPRSGPERDALFCARELRPMHALPRGHRQGSAAHDRRGLGCRHLARPGASDGRCFDLWFGTSCAQPHSLCVAVFSA